MYNSRKNSVPPVIEQTSVWICNKESCTCWMRDHLSFEDVPKCPICSSPMTKGTKMLPVLER